MRQANPRSPSGILVIDKPRGMTSHDVVAALRRITGVRRIGHAGTLDPLATGVLPALIGQATRLAEYFLSWPKTYRFTIRLGMSTDTYDADGRVTLERDPSAVTAATIEAALPQLIGAIEQYPPPYSAIKRGGRPLYAYARAGQPVPLEARMVRVDRLQLLSFVPPFAEIVVDCGSGTYARSLAHDLGEALGCGAHIVSLTRTAVGPLTLESAVSLEAVDAAAQRGEWERLLLPADAVLADLPATSLDEAAARAVRNGMTVRPAGLPDRPSDGDLARAYDPGNPDITRLAATIADAGRR